VRGANPKPTGRLRRTKPIGCSKLGYDNSELWISMTRPIGVQWSNNSIIPLCSMRAMLAVETERFLTKREGIGMVASDSFAEFLREQLAPLGHVTMRRMFGKTGVFCDGVMFGMVRDNTLYFRVDDDNRATFQEAESFPPLNYKKRGGTIDLSFWCAPERLFEEPDELVIWARAALQAARRVAAKRERAAPRRKSKPQPT